MIGSSGALYGSYHGYQNCITVNLIPSLPLSLCPLQKSLQEKLESIYLASQGKTREHEEKMDVLSTKNAQLFSAHVYTVWELISYAHVHTWMHESS